MSAYNLVTILQWSWNNLVTFLKLRHSTCENKCKYYIHMYWIWESTKNHSTILQQSSKCLVSGPTYFTNLVKCKIVVKSWNNPETILQQSCWMQDCLNFRNRRSIHISTFHFSNLCKILCKALHLHAILTKKYSNWVHIFFHKFFLVT